MHLIETINNELEIDNKKIKWISMLDNPQFFEGLVYNLSEKVDFEKLSISSKIQLREYGSTVSKELDRFHNSCSGTSICFKSDAPVLYIQCKMKRVYSNAKLTLWGSSGLDVYEYNDTTFKWRHRTVFSHAEGKRMFLESISNNGKITRIFLPNYNTIEDLLFGIDRKCSLTPASFLHKKPIIVYGNSVTQGASASRSGNSYPNIVSRMMNRSIINLSISSCCKGNEGLAEQIGSLNCFAIVIDYQRNAYDLREFRKNFDRFIGVIRKWHNNTPIIFLKTFNFNNWKAYESYDKYIEVTYNRLRKEGNNSVFLINTMDLFEESDYEYLAVDGCHCNDIVFFRIAKEICSILDNLSI